MHSDGPHPGHASRGRAARAGRTPAPPVRQIRARAFFCSKGASSRRPRLVGASMCYTLGTMAGYHAEHAHACSAHTPPRYALLSSGPWGFPRCCSCPWAAHGALKCRLQATPPVVCKPSPLTRKGREMRQGDYASLLLLFQQWRQKTPGERVRGWCRQHRAALSHTLLSMALQQGAAHTRSKCKGWGLHRWQHCLCSGGVLTRLPHRGCMHSATTMMLPGSPRACIGTR
jgi:hypothetical protein